MALAEFDRHLEIENVAFENPAPILVNFLDANENTHVNIIPFVNHLESDDYHFELAVESKDHKRFNFTRINEQQFEDAFTWLEGEICSLTGSRGKMLTIVEDGRKWRKKQITRLRRTNTYDAGYLPIIDQLAKMKTALWIAHAPTYRR